MGKKNHLAVRCWVLELTSSLEDNRARYKQDTSGFQAEGSLDMRLTFNIFLFGCWMSWQKWEATGQRYSKPSISVSSRDVVTLGGSVNIYCKREDSPYADFYFEKEGASVAQKGMKIQRGDAVLFITNAKPSDAGIYMCLYCFFPCSHWSHWSDRSDKVYIYLKDPNLPKPSIQVNDRGHHALGVNVIIECWGAERGLIFSLHKSEEQILSQIAEQAGGTAKFSFSTVTSKNAGNYTCQYHSSVNPFIWSEPSDPVELVARDLSLSKPSIKVNPSGQHALGTDANIECQGPENGLIFSLHKSGIRISQKTDPGRNTTQFHLSMVRLEDAGSYTCQYQSRKSPFVWSQPSDPVALIVRDPSLSKPSIDVRPRGPLVLGSNVTIECQGPENGLNLSLFKSKDLIASQKADRSRNTTVFPLSMVTAEDAGRYSCQYHSSVHLFLWSEPSDPIQIAVKGSMTIVWAGCAAGLLLFLFLLFFAFVLYRKRRKGCTESERSQPVNLPLEPDAGTDHTGVTYAVLNQQPLKIKQAVIPEMEPESCVYASVAKDRFSKGQ